MKIIIIFIHFFVSFEMIIFARADDFSSFLTTNASLAIIIDEEFTKQRGVDIFEKVKSSVDDIVRKNLENGGINIRYYRWGYVRLKKDFVAAVIVTDCQRTWKFFEMCEVNSILLLAITEANCPRLPIQEAVMIPVIAKGEEIPQLLLDMKLQSVINWKSSIVLFDSLIDDEATQIISSLGYASPKSLFNPIALHLFKIDTEFGTENRKHKIRTSLQKFKFKRDNHFIVFTTAYEEIIQVATSMNMFDVFNQWLFFIPQDANLDEIYAQTEQLNEGANIAYAINSTISKCQEDILCSVTEVIYGFVLGLSKVIEQESSMHGQISDEEWETIRLTKKERQQEILAHLKIYLNYQSKCSGCSKWTLRTMESWGRTGQYKQDVKIYDKSAKKRYIFSETGIWNPMSGFITSDVLFPHVEHRFRNKTLNILTFNNHPWQNIVMNEKMEIVETSGFVMKVLRELSLKLNFSYNLHVMQLEGDSTNVNLSSNNYLGSKTDMLNNKLIQTMLQNKYFMIAAGLTIDENDQLEFNYTVPISTQTYAFLSKRPDEVSRVYLFTAPFQINTWGCLAAVLTIVGPFLYLLNKYSAKEDFKTTGLMKIQNCYWYVYGALLQQGGMHLPKSDSGRFLVGIWWIVVIILVTSYCGNLVAFLTFPKYNAGNNYLTDIFDHNQISIFGLRNRSFFAKYAKLSTRNEFKKFMEKVTLYSNAKDEDLSSIMQGKRINVDWRINLRLRMQKDFNKNKKCNFIMSKEDLMDERIGLIFPAKSPYLDLFNEEIIKLQKMGFIYKWNQEYFPSMDRCSMSLQNRQIVNHMVDLNDMQGCFLVLLLGFSFSTFIIIGEIIWHHCKSSKPVEEFIN